MKKLITYGSCLLFLVASLATGAIAPQSLEERQAGAKVIVRGEVTSAEVTTEGSPMNSDWVVMLSIEIAEVEKGDQVGAGENINVRCWRLKRRSPVLDGPSGHDDIPAVGSQVRMWLNTQGQRVWHPIQPNGVELLDGSPALDFSKVEGRWGWTLVVLVVVMGFVLVVVLISVLRRNKTSKPAE
ncbi:MAG: hypothetical protein ACI8XO_002352 [Verrucomicrobiales bacterium]|jgi:hypothetical protein